MTPSTVPAIVESLRQRAAGGESACDLLDWLSRQLGLSGTSLRIIAIEYFREAFLLSLPVAMTIGAAPVFRDGSAGATWVNDELAREMERTKASWAPAPSH